MSAFNVHCPDEEASEPLSLTKVFHRLGQMLPDDQQLVTVPPSMSAAEALNIMDDTGFSQLPVAINGHVLGVFSYRSFAKKVVELGDDLLKQQQPPGKLEVEECIEKPVFAHISDEFRTWFDAIEIRDAILVGHPERVLGVITAIDMLRYLYAVASPFVLIAEIELTLRGLIRLAVNTDQLKECCDQSLNHYADDKRPYRLEDMTFSDYVSIVGNGRNWRHFEPVFHGNRVRTRTKLTEVGDLRNDVFHFRRQLSVEEYGRLAELRDWMLRKATMAELGPKEKAQ